MNDNSDGNVMLRLSESETNLESCTSQNNWYKGKLFFKNDWSGGETGNKMLLSLTLTRTLDWRLDSGMIDLTNLSSPLPGRRVD